MHNRPKITDALLSALDEMGQMTRQGMVAKAVLLINHILAAEPAATQRLQHHAGRTVCLKVHPLPSWPDTRWLPPLMFCLTPAGLVEVQHSPDDAATLGSADLTVSVDLAQAVREGFSGAGAHRGVSLSGSADLAMDMSWVLDNVRWDWQAAVSQCLPAAVAAPTTEAISAGASHVADALHKASRWVASVLERRS